MNKNYQNYHSHKWFTNKTIHDSCVGYEAYIDRALELNQRVVTSVEHGYQGNYFELNELICKKNIELQKRRDKGEINVPSNLKFVFGAEVYWVKDRKTKDRSNCHMVILAKTDIGRKAINLMLSKASEDGFFDGRPRIDFELLFSLPKNDVFITTACIQYWKYEDIVDITLKISDYFGENFSLEVQNHNTEKQKTLNKKILELSKKHSIKIIAGMDSHYINENQAIIRENIMKYKSSKENEEENWYVDYPSYEEAYNRFLIQGILSQEQIEESLNNTNLILNFEDIDLGLKTIKTDDDKYSLYSEIKLPTIDGDLTQEEKDIKLKTILDKEWEKYRKDENIIKDEDIKQHEKGIDYEYGEIKTTKMADYFLIHYKALKRGVKKYGGKITKRGRGSAVGYFCNTLLGFSKVDRFKTPIKIYPERFMTANRILKARTCPDIDNNIDRQEPFQQAFKDLLGEHSIYPMIAFSTIAKSKAIKMYMSVNNESPSIQDEVSKQLQEYDKALKHCETDEEKEEINIEDYITKEHLHYVKESIDYQGIVDGAKSHACGHLLLNGDIREEIGVIRCESKTTKKSTLVACIDGSTADHYKYLKTDLLIVDVVGLTEAIWDRIGEKSISNTELERRLANEEGRKAWEIYEKGYTVCVNQCEKEGTKHNCMRYKMKNTAELSAFVAGVRPGFRSLFNNFIERKPYSTGVPQLDEILKDSYSYMLYQESIMAFLNWLGIDMKETYEIVKKISKKIYLDHPEQMEELKNKVRPNWIKNTGSIDHFDEIFQIVNDAGSYAFNSAHSYCVGNDGAEIAYLKAYYPYETYEVCLNWYFKKNKKDKITALKEEMLKAFGIKEGQLKWGRDNRQFSLDKTLKCINPCLSSLKGMGKEISNELYNLYQHNKYTNFLDLIRDIKNTSVNNTMLQNLIKIDYFSDFGTPNQLLGILEMYNTWEGCKSVSKDKILKNGFSIEEFKPFGNETEKQINKIDSKALIEYLISKVNVKTTVYNRLVYQHEVYGYCFNKYPKFKNKALVLDVNLKYSPILTVYILETGEEIKYKAYKRDYNKNTIEKYDLIELGDITKKQKTKKVNDEWINIEGFNYWLKGWKKLN